MRANMPGRAFSAESLQRATPSLSASAPYGADPARRLTDDEWNWVYDNRRLWVHYAKRAVPRRARGWTNDEIFHYLIPTIVRAVARDSWRSDGGASLESYVGTAIWRIMSSAATTHHWYPCPRVRRRTEKFGPPLLLGNYNLGDWVPAVHPDEPDNTPQLETVREWLAGSRPRWRAIVEFVFCGPGAGVRTLKQASAEFGVSKERIRQIVSPLLAQLRQRLGYAATGDTMTVGFMTKPTVAYCRAGRAKSAGMKKKMLSI